MTLPEQPWSVLLLHEQLQDDRIWDGLKRPLERYAQVQTVWVPPLRTLGPPAWADHIEQYARETISQDTPAGVIDLVVTVGAAGGAGTSLVAKGCARAALLLNPDPSALANEPTLHFDEQFVDDRLSAFFEALHPYLDELATGTLSQAGIETLASASLANLDELRSEHKELLWRIAVEQLAAAQPLTFDRVSSRGAPNWLEQVGTIATRCTVALSACGGLQDQLARVLRRQTPELDVIALHSTSWFVWLHAPETVSNVIHDLLRRNRTRTGTDR